jgi:hypothetical protein
MSFRMKDGDKAGNRADDTDECGEQGKPEPSSSRPVGAVMGP